MYIVAYYHVVSIYPKMGLFINIRRRRRTKVSYIFKVNDRKLPNQMSISENETISWNYIVTCFIFYLFLSIIKFSRQY